MAVGAAGALTGAVMAAGELQNPAPLATTSATDSDFVAEVTGVGETLLIVVGGDFGSEAEATSKYQSFGDMQGFYVDSSSNYRVVGLYEQTNPTLATVVCDGSNDLYDRECASIGTKQLTLLQAPKLRLVPPTEQLGLLADESPCGRKDLRPCTGARLGHLLAADGQLKPGRYLQLSAFRTKAGAEEFLDMTHRAEYQDTVVLQVVKTAGPYVGLGQEGNPDGSGILTAPLPDPLSFQR